MKPYYQDNDNIQIYCGDSFGVLKSLPSESVDCAITSPPYWALRDYGIESSIWDGDEKCKHKWNKRDFKLHSGRGDAQKSGKYSEQKPIPDKELSDHFCSLCGAWRGSLGLEPTFQLYIKHLCDIFDEIKRVLKKSGTCWVNLGDTYGGSGAGTGGKEDIAACKESYLLPKGSNKSSELRGTNYQKSLIQIPSRFSIEMTNRDWILRNEIIWHKPNCMPSSVRDRFTVDFEKIFFFSKAKSYWFERQFEAQSPDGRQVTTVKAKEYSQQHRDGERWPNPQGRNKRCVWNITTKPFKEAHFAVFPEELVETPIKAGCPESGVVLDPFMGAGTVGVVAKRLNRKFIGIDLKEDYIKMGIKRIMNTQRDLFSLRK